MTTHRMTATSLPTRRTVAELVAATATRPAGPGQWSEAGSISGDLADLLVTPTWDDLVGDPEPQREPRPGRRGTRVVGALLLALVALAAVGTAAAVIVFKVGFSTVLSPSMEPGLHPGDLLLTRAESTADLAVGDVVVLPRPDVAGERYAHRVVSVRWAEGQPIVRTKGDNNTDADPQELRITSGSVPVAFGHVPKVGTLALHGQQAWVRIVLIVLIGLAVFVALRRAILGRR